MLDVLLNVFKVSFGFASSSCSIDFIVLLLLLFLIHIRVHLDFDVLGSLSFIYANLLVVCLNFLSVLLETFVSQPIETAIVFKSLLALISPLVLQSLELIIAKQRLLLLLLRVSLDVRFIPALVENVFGLLLNGDLEGVFTGTPNFFDAVMLTLKHFLCFYNFAALVFDKEVTHSVIRVD